MNKETIAKALHKHDFPDLRWEREKDFIQEIYNNQAEAVIKALEADVPKELIEQSNTYEFSLPAGVVAIIAVVKDGEEYKLHVTDNDELTDDWWRALPEAMGKTVDTAILGRRVKKNGTT